ncbi:unnamed protein product [Mytilus coruscus]|uniref:Uncharacterized protein n=1 Tax=Mytilus coruscus TaxID=42192 RepID=A0A6J8EHG4_MYTCO|nr:unnamed protein product [Mytilus coruscus]
MSRYSRNSKKSSNLTKSTTNSTNSNAFKLPPKGNLRIMMVNCRSIVYKKAEPSASTYYIKPDIIVGVSDKEIQQALMNLSLVYGLVQIHNKPTRKGNLLVLVFTNNPSLIKSTGNAAGISDHDIVITDSLIKPYYCKQHTHKRYIFGKANWDQIKTDINMITKDICNHINEMPIDKTWQTLKNEVQASIDLVVSSKVIRKSMQFHG